jgi:MFS family permease
MSVQMSGLVFSVTTITYSLTSFFLQCVPSRTNGLFFGRLMHGGIILFVIAMIFSGPAPFLPDTLSFMITGLFIMGIGGALINNNNTSAIFLTEKAVFLSDQTAPG